MSNNFNANLNRAIKVFFNVETFIPFLIGSLCLGIFSNALYDAIKKSIGESIPNFLIIAGSSLLIFSLAAIIFTLRLSHATQAKVDPLLAKKATPKKHQGLICLVSNQQPCKVAIEFHLSKPELKLKQCWLICSIRSLPDAQALRAEYRDRVTIDEPIVIEDVYNPLEYVQKIESIYTDKLPKGWQASDIIADFAGMTASASVGMALLCYAKNRPLQYTPAVVDPNTGRITGSAEPIEINLQ